MDNCAVPRLLLLPVLAASLLNAQSVTQYVIATVAGNGTAAFAGDGGAATSASVNIPHHIALDVSGNLYIADTMNHRVRKLTPDGVISTVAGTGDAGYSGDSAAGTSAKLQHPSGIAVDSGGNVYIADSANQVVRKLTSSGTISTVAGDNTLGAGYAGDGAAATSALLWSPVGLAVDSGGNLYIADAGNSRIRKVSSSGTITTFAGSNYVGFDGDGGAATNAKLNRPEDVAIGPDGAIYIADTFNHRIRKVTADGIITTVAENLNYPRAIDVDSTGRLAIADTYNARVRILTAGAAVNVTGELFCPSGIAWSGANIYVTDSQHSLIRRLTPAGAIIAPSPIVSSAATSTDYGALPGVAAPGAWIDIRGLNFSQKARSWAKSDFDSSGKAPAQLEGASVAVGGKRAFLAYVSPDRITAQIPSDAPLGTQDLTVTTAGGTSAPLRIEISAAQPAILAPPSFSIQGRQYAAAAIGDTGLYALPERPARPGETLVFQAIGLGPVTPITNAGEPTRQSNMLTSEIAVLFGDTPAMVSSAGLAMYSIGIYQVSVVVPDNVEAGPVPLSITVGGVRGRQTLYVVVE